MRPSHHCQATGGALPCVTKIRSYLHVRPQSVLFLFIYHFYVRGVYGAVSYNFDGGGTCNKISKNLLMHNLIHGRDVCCLQDGVARSQSTFLPESKHGKHTDEQRVPRERVPGSQRRFTWETQRKTPALTVAQIVAPRAFPRHDLKRATDVDTGAPWADMAGRPEGLQVTGQRAGEVCPEGGPQRPAETTDDENCPRGSARAAGRAEGQEQGLVPRVDQTASAFPGLGRAWGRVLPEESRGRGLHRGPLHPFPRNLTRKQQSPRLTHLVRTGLQNVSSSPRTAARDTKFVT